MGNLLNLVFIHGCQMQWRVQRQFQLLIHAATMVTAGVFLLILMSPLIEVSIFASNTILVVDSLTCIFAASVAIFQNDIKKIIAYSTCSQLGYMFMAIGASAYSLAYFHLISHAFFKALLF